MFAQVLEKLDYVGFLFKILLNSGDEIIYVVNIITP